MEVKPGYRQTEVGVIPEDWDVLPFEALAHIERGKFTARPRDDPRYYGGDVPFIQTGDVTNSSGWIKTYSQTLNNDGLKVSKLFRQGTLFFTIAANIGDVGFACFDTACPDSIVAITPAKTINKVWLAHELRMRKPSFERLASHNAQLNINLEKLRPYLLPVPTPGDQEAIAGALSDADDLIESLERLLAKKRQLKQGAMQELLTGKKRLPGFAATPGTKRTDVGWIPADWDVKATKEMGHIEAGKALAIGGPGHRRPYLRTRNVLDGRIDLGDVLSMPMTDSEFLHFALRCGDVLLNEGQSLDLVGRCSMYREEYPGPCAIQNQLVRFRPGADVSAEFAEQVFRYCQKSGAFAGIATQTTSVAHLGVSRFQNLRLAWPSSLAEQRAIASVLSDMDAELALMEVTLAKARHLKQGMVQELLTGRIRLPVGKATK